MALKWCWIIILMFVSFELNLPLRAEAFTLDGYFSIITLAAKKRDLWRKIFLGRDLGFVASPWLFKDRVKPPFVPILKSFPRYPEKGHYRNERAPSFSSFSFPQFYSNLHLNHRLPPPVRNVHRKHFGLAGHHPQMLGPPGRRHIPQNIPHEGR